MGLISEFRVVSDDLISGNGDLCMCSNVVYNDGELPMEELEILLHSLLRKDNGGQTPWAITMLKRREIRGGKRAIAICMPIYEIWYDDVLERAIDEAKRSESKPTNRDDLKPWFATVLGYTMINFAKRQRRRLRHELERSRLRSESDSASSPAVTPDHREWTQNNSSRNLSLVLDSVETLLANAAASGPEYKPLITSIQQHLAKIRSRITDKRHAQHRRGVNSNGEHLDAFEEFGKSLSRLMSHLDEHDPSSGFPGDSCTGGMESEGSHMLSVTIRSIQVLVVRSFFAAFSLVYVRQAALLYQPTAQESQQGLLTELVEYCNSHNFVKSFDTGRRKSHRVFKVQGTDYPCDRPVLNAFIACLVRLSQKSPDLNLSSLINGLANAMKGAPPP